MQISFLVLFKDRNPHSCSHFKATLNCSVFCTRQTQQLLIHTSQSCRLQPCIDRQATQLTSAAVASQNVTLCAFRSCTRPLSRTPHHFASLSTNEDLPPCTSASAAGRLGASPFPLSQTRRFLSVGFARTAYQRSSKPLPPPPHCPSAGSFPHPAHGTWSPSEFP